MSIQKPPLVVLTYAARSHHAYGFLDDIYLRNSGKALSGWPGVLISDAKINKRTAGDVMLQVLTELELGFDLVC